MRREHFQFLGNSAFVFGCRFSGAALTFLTATLLSRWMGAEQLGIYLNVFSWFLLISTVANLGYSEATIRFVGHYLAQSDDGRLHGYIRRGQQVTAAAGIAGAGLALLFVLGSRGWIADDHVIPLAIGMLCIPFYSYMRLYSSFAHALSRFSLAFIPNALLRPALFLMGVTVAWWMGFNLSAERAMGIHVALIVLITLIQIPFFYRGPTLTHLQSAPVYETKSWFRASGPLLLIALFTQYFYEISIVLIGPHLSSADVAIFGMSYRTALLIAFGLFAINAVMMPPASRLYHEGDVAALQRLITRTTLLKFGPSLLAVAAVVLFGREILSIFGEEFVAGYHAFVVLALSQLLIAGVGPVDSLMRLSGHQDQCLITFAVSLVLAIVLNTVLVPLFGILGAAFAVFIVVAFWTTWLHILVVRHVGIRPSVLAFRGLVAHSQ